MSRGVNKWIGIGNACADPDSRFMPNGNAVTNLTIACNNSYKDKNTGQMVEKPEFVRIVFFNKLAEVVTEYVRKGSKLFVEGSLRTRSWEQDGVTRYATEIVASEMQMLDSKPQGQQPAPSPQQQTSGQQGSPHGESGGPADYDDFDQDIPF